jgi:hypothetical protein
MVGSAHPTNRSEPEGGVGRYPVGEGIFSSGSGVMSGQAEPAGWRLWIDGVGVYRLHLAESFTLGGPAESGAADLSLLAPLSRVQAEITAHGDRFRLTPRGACQVDGKPVTGPVWLNRSAELTLGDVGLGNVVLGFTQPSPLSGTARIDFRSDHRPRLHLDGVLLLRGTCLVGQGGGRHIVWPDCDLPLVLFARGAGLAFRNDTGWLVDGRETAGVTEVAPGTILTRGDLRVRFEAEPVRNDVRLASGFSDSLRPAPEVAIR